MEGTRPEDLDPEELESHRPWLMRLAAAILRDRDLAEDCVQEVLLTALRGGPAHSKSLRPWLKRSVVNAARRAIEREVKRRHVESIAAGERRPTTPRETLVFRELQAELLRGVCELDEPYRRAVLLRYEKDLAPREIARELDVSTKTVDSWLYRANGKLREHLDRRLDGRRSWSVVLVAGLLGDQRESPTPPLRAGAAVAGVLAVVGLVWVAVDRWSETTTPDPVASAPRIEDEPVEVRAPGPTPVAARASVQNVQSAAEPAPEPATSATWAGRVLDANGAPVAGLGLRFEPLSPGNAFLFADRDSAGYEEFLQRIDLRIQPSADSSRDVWQTTSASDGGFSLPMPDQNGWIRVEAGEWSTVSTAVIVEYPPPPSPVVRVAPSRTIEGRVLDDDGDPLQSVRVELRQPDRFCEREDGLPTRIAHEPSVFTDEAGSFVLESAPFVPDGTLRFRKNGFEDEDLVLAELSENVFVVHLHSARSEHVLAGRVLDPLGRPIEGACLSFDWTTIATTDERGEFRLEPPDPANGAERPVRGVLRAAARGYQPLQLAVAREDARWERLVLAFEEEALDITGIVLRADGTPHEHAAVWAPRPDVLGLPPDERPPLFTEHVMGGAQDGGSLEATITRSEGFFLLRGMQDKPYVLRVADLETREWFETEPIQAGVVGVTLQFRPGGLFPEARGVVVDKQGNALESVRVARAYPRLDAPLPNGKRYRTRLTGEPVLTDAEGRFVLKGVARKGGVLLAYGTSLQTRKIELDLVDDVTDLRVVASRVCRVVVERGNTSPDFSAFAFLDANGAPVPFRPAVQGTAGGVSLAPMPGDRSAEYLVYDLAVEIALGSESGLVARIPIELDAESENVIRP